MLTRSYSKLSQISYSTIRRQWTSNSNRRTNDVFRRSPLFHLRTMTITPLLSKVVEESSSSSSSSSPFSLFAGMATASVTLLSTAAFAMDYSSVTQNEAAKSSHHPSPLPSETGHDDNFEDSSLLTKDKKLPVYTSEDVARNNGQDGSPIWMSYGGMVYDVTNFIHNHPGGSERIMLAAGGPVEPYWHLYRQHFASDLPMRLMEDLLIGTLDEKDQDAIDEQMEKLANENTDPYAHEPKRSPMLIVHGDTPMNAEVPAEVLTRHYLTPNEYFYIRHHHPVPIMMQKDIDNYAIEIDVSEFMQPNKDGESSSTPTSTVKLTLEQLKQLPKVEYIATLQCSGNRRGQMNDVKRTSGTSWNQGAISTAKWGGVLFSDVLKAAGVEDPIALAKKDGIQKYARFESLDDMKASIHLEKAVDPFGDVILAYEMNDEPLPRDHGFPVRVVVPGYAAVRQVKWLKKIEIASKESEGAWQRGLNYKTLPPNVVDASTIDLDKMPSMTEVAVFSGITELEVIKKVPAGEQTTVKAKGWAWAGGGRNIVRIDITSDGGKTWSPANIVQGEDQPFGRAWAWVFWEAEVPAIVNNNGTVEIHSKAVDLAFNSQPDDVAHSWNVRGLGNNAWYKATVKV